MSQTHHCFTVGVSATGSYSKGKENLLSVHLFSPDIVARVIQLEPSTAVALVQLNTLFHRAAAEVLYEGGLASIADNTIPWTDTFPKSSTSKTMTGLFSDHRRAHDMRACCAILLGVSESISIPNSPH